MRRLTIEIDAIDDTRCGFCQLQNRSSGFCYLFRRVRKGHGGPGGWGFERLPECVAAEVAEEKNK